MTRSFLVGGYKCFGVKCSFHLHGTYLPYYAILYPKMPGHLQTVTSTLLLCWCSVILSRKFRHGRDSNVPKRRQVRKCPQKVTRMVSSLCFCPFIRGYFPQNLYIYTHTHTHTHTHTECVNTHWKIFRDFLKIPFKHYGGTSAYFDHNLALSNTFLGESTFVFITLILIFLHFYPFLPRRCHWNFSLT
jgi:hypothetical protein